LVSSSAPPSSPSPSKSRKKSKAEASSSSSVAAEEKGSSNSNSNSNSPNSKAREKEKKKRFRMYEFNSTWDIFEAKIDMKSPCEVVYDSIQQSKVKANEKIHYRFDITELGFFRNDSQISDLVTRITQKLRQQEKYKDFTLDRFWTDNQKREVQITVVPLDFK